jgi:acyl phosphate:glycerol-3-phosphate acyltransferase
MNLPDWLVAAGLVGLGYLSGSVPFSVLMARLLSRPDPRTVGSGRTGGTNAVRTFGWGGGLVVGLLDIAKGAVPVLAARAVTGGWPFLEALTGIASVIGANRSIFLRFHGGRGVATGIGAMLVIDWRVIAVAAPVFFGVIALTRFVSLGSLLGTAAGVIALALFVVAGGTNPVYLVYGIVAGSLIWLAHTDNIDRLLKGRERRFSTTPDDMV